MEEKICSKCQKILSFDNFHKDKNRKDGLYPICKECRKNESKQYYKKYKKQIIENRKSYYENNKELVSKTQLEYYTKHKKEILEKRKQYRINNLEKVYICQKNSYLKNKEHYKNMKKIWEQNNREKLNEQERERFCNDNIYKLKHSIRCNIYDAFARKKYRKSKSTEKIVGCSLDFLCDYLKNTYSKIYGIEYDGTQKVHIDHIIPLALAKTEEDVYRLCNYTNLQLLNAEDNIRKRDNLNFNLYQKN